MKRCWFAEKERQRERERERERDRERERERKRERELRDLSSVEIEGKKSPGNIYSYYG
jgi:hypothetical protein